MLVENFLKLSSFAVYCLELEDVFNNHRDNDLPPMLALPQLLLSGGGGR